MLGLAQGERVNRQRRVEVGFGRRVCRLLRMTDPWLHLAQPVANPSDRVARLLELAGVENITATLSDSSAAVTGGSRGNYQRAVAKWCRLSKADGSAMASFGARARFYRHCERSKPS